VFENSFIDACLAGDALLNDIEDYIEYWHENESDLELNEFLGMTSYEYANWLKTGDDMVLRDIIEARNIKMLYQNYEKMPQERRIAARAYKKDDIEEVKSQKRISL